MQRNYRLQLCLLIALASLAVSAGCTNIRFGAVPDTEALESALHPGVSTKGDVLEVLGAPRGYGMAHFSEVEGERVIWFYEFIRSNGSDVDMKMLLVFFDGEKYEGYLWFSSLETVAVTR